MCNTPLHSDCRQFLKEVGWDITDQVAIRKGVERDQAPNMRLAPQAVTMVVGDGKCDRISEVGNFGNRLGNLTVEVPFETQL